MSDLMLYPKLKSRNKQEFWRQFFDQSVSPPPKKTEGRAKRPPPSHARKSFIVSSVYWLRTKHTTLYNIICFMYAQLCLYSISMMTTFKACFCRCFFTILLCKMILPWNKKCVRIRIIQKFHLCVLTANTNTISFCLLYNCFCIAQLKSKEKTVEYVSEITSIA